MRSVALLFAPFVLSCAESTNARGAVSELDDPPSADPRVDIPAARELDQQGVRAYVEGRYADAERLFSAAYRVGGPPTELWNIARSREKLDDAEGAAKALELYLDQSGLTASDRTQAERELRALEGRPSLLVVATTPEGATLLVDGRAAGTTPASIEVGAGTHALSARRQGYTSESRTVEARFGRSIFVALDLKPGAK